MPRIICVAEDGSRIGAPAQESVLYLGWVARQDCGFFLPPQVAPEVLLTKAEGPFTLVRLAAMCGFKGMAVVYLKKFFEESRVAVIGGRRPELDMDLVKALIEHHCPEMPADEVSHAMAQRGTRLPSRFAAYINGDNLDKADHIIDESELLEAKADLAKERLAKAGSRSSAKPKLAPKPLRSKGEARRR